jgi:hypothetical protein
MEQFKSWEDMTDLEQAQCTCTEPFYYTYELVVEILQMHPVECVFELDAPAKIFNRMMEAGFYTPTDLTNERIKEFRECWTLSEIYCPHEGIDRLAECGVKTLDWEMA